MTNPKDAFAGNAGNDNLTRFKALIDAPGDTTAEILALLDQITDAGEKRQCADMMENALLDVLVRKTADNLAMYNQIKPLIDLVGKEDLFAMLRSDPSAQMDKMTEQMHMVVLSLKAVYDIKGNEADSFIKGYLEGVAAMDNAQYNNPLYHFEVLADTAAKDPRFTSTAKPSNPFGNGPGL